MKTLLLTLLSLASLIPVHGEPPVQTVDRLVRAIRTELPEGWKASYDKKNVWLEVSRDEAVLSISAAPNGPGDEKPERSKFIFAFRVTALVPPAEYRRLAAENAKTGKEIEALYHELTRMRMSGKFDSFSPVTDEQKAAVARYETLKKTLHSLPDFYFADLSLDWRYNSPDNPILSVTDDRARTECTHVQEKILRLFSTYESAQPQ